MNKNGYNLFSRKFCFTAEILRKFRGNFVTAAVRKRISTHFGRGSGSGMDFKNTGTGRNGNQKSLPWRTLSRYARVSLHKFLYAYTLHILCDIQLIQGRIEDFAREKAITWPEGTPPRGTPGGKLSRPLAKMGVLGCVALQRRGADFGF